MTTSPAFTRTPSRTRSSLTTPPVGCCTFLTFVSTTMEPDATTGPDSSVVVAQPPRPPATRSAMVIAAKTWRRIERLAPLAFVVMASSPRLQARALPDANGALCSRAPFGAPLPSVRTFVCDHSRLPEASRHPTGPKDDGQCRSPWLPLFL